MYVYIYIYIINIYLYKCKYIHTNMRYFQKKMCPLYKVGGKQLLALEPSWKQRGLLLLEVRATRNARRLAFWCVQMALGLEDRGMVLHGHRQRFWQRFRRPPQPFACRVALDWRWASDESTQHCPSVHSESSSMWVWHSPTAPSRPPSYPSGAPWMWTAPALVGLPD